MKYLFESLDQQRRIPMSKVTWDKIEPQKDPNLPKWHWQRDSVSLPLDFMSSEEVNSIKAFERWYRGFTNHFGFDGELVETRPTYWSIEGNPKWDKEKERGSKSVSKYYDEKGNKGYAGD